MKIKSISYPLGIACFVTLLGTSLQFAKAWTEPTQAPPNGNVSAPINTGSQLQTKNGPLIISNNMGSFSNGLRVIHSNGTQGIDIGYDAIQKFTNNGNSELLLNPNGGNVGIGKSSPSYKLDVNGNFRANSITFPDGTTQSSAAVSSPWVSQTDTYNISASDCNGDFTSWHSLTIALPRYAMNVNLALTAGSGTWLELLDSSWTRIGYYGWDCRPNGTATNTWCGWGNQNPGTNIKQPASLPAGSWVYAYFIGYCHYGSTHSGQVKVTYMKPMDPTYNVSNVAPSVW